MAPSPGLPTLLHPHPAPAAAAINANGAPSAPAAWPSSDDVMVGAPLALPIAFTATPGKLTATWTEPAVNPDLSAQYKITITDTTPGRTSTPVTGVLSALFPASGSTYNLAAGSKRIEVEAWNSNGKDVTTVDLSVPFSASPSITAATAGDSGGTARVTITVGALSEEQRSTATIGQFRIQVSGLLDLGSTQRRRAGSQQPGAAGRRAAPAVPSCYSACGAQRRRRSARPRCAAAPSPPPPSPPIAGIRPR